MTAEIQNSLHKLLNSCIDIVILFYGLDSDPPCIMERINWPFFGAARGLEANC